MMLPTSYDTYLYLVSTDRREERKFSTDSPKILLKMYLQSPHKKKSVQKQAFYQRLLFSWITLKVFICDP